MLSQLMLLACEPASHPRSPTATRGNKRCKSKASRIQQQLRWKRFVTMVYFFCSYSPLTIRSSRWAKTWMDGAKKPWPIVAYKFIATAAAECLALLPISVVYMSHVHPSSLCLSILRFKSLALSNNTEDRVYNQKLICIPSCWLAGWLLLGNNKKLLQEESITLWALMCVVWLVPQEKTRRWRRRCGRRTTTIWSVSIDLQAISVLFAPHLLLLSIWSIFVSLEQPLFDAADAAAASSSADIMEWHEPHHPSSGWIFN